MNPATKSHKSHKRTLIRNKLLRHIRNIESDLRRSHQWSKAKEAIEARKAAGEPLWVEIRKSVWWNGDVLYIDEGHGLQPLTEVANTSIVNALQELEAP